MEMAGPLVTSQEVPGIFPFHINVPSRTKKWNLFSEILGYFAHENEGELNAGSHAANAAEITSVHEIQRGFISTSQFVRMFVFVYN